jgi:hypothetical protein
VRGDARWRACTGTKAGAGLTASPSLPQNERLVSNVVAQLLVSCGCAAPTRRAKRVEDATLAAQPPFQRAPQRQLRPAASAQHGCAGTHGEGCGPPHVREGVQCLPAVYRQSACARRQHTHTAGLAAGLLPALWHPPAWAPCAGWPSWAVAAPAAVIWAPAAGLQRRPPGTRTQAPHGGAGQAAAPCLPPSCGQAAVATPGRPFPALGGRRLPNPCPVSACLLTRPAPCFPPRWRCLTGLTW